MIVIEDYSTLSYEERATEIIERKGIGHPDTLADLIAENFSNNFSNFCLSKSESILNHWVDKVCLKGATTSLDFGKSKILKPINAYLFGRVPEFIFQEKIDIKKLFKKSVENIFSKIFIGLPILENTNFIVDTNWTSGKDHPESFYFPKNSNELECAWDSKKSNDTVMCTAFAPYTTAENLVVEIENFINSPAFKKKFTATGWDVKVLLVRCDLHLDITICIPFIADRTPSVDFYYSVLKEIKSVLTFFISRKLLSYKKNYNFDLELNTKDKDNNVYLTAFGTALDKGDYGAVGRGNKYQGLISVNRQTNIEAVAGKNPLNHSGKLLTIIATEIAMEVQKFVECDVNIDISTKNGDPIISPSYVFVKTNKTLNDTEKSKIKEIIGCKVKLIPGLYQTIIKEDVVDFHRGNIRLTT